MNRPPHTVQKPNKKLSTSQKAALIAIPAVLLIALILILISVLNRPEVQAPGEASNSGGTGGGTPTQSEVPLVQENSHVLDDAGEGAPVLVEFLDFECEACGAAFPLIEELRATFGDRVTFVARYFPLEGHFNAQRAARAVEAAAQQGQFEAMYKKMYETQTQWSEQQVPKDDLFRQYAQELGLDMARWDADYASDATWARIKADIDDGTALGVTGTPTFFLNGQRLEPKSANDITTAIEQALGQ